MLNLFDNKAKCKNTIAISGLKVFNGTLVSDIHNNNIKKFSTSNFLRAPKVFEILSIKVGNDHEINLYGEARVYLARLARRCSNETSMYVINNNMTNIFNKIDSTIKGLSSDNRLLDEDIIILNFLNPDQYDNLNETLVGMSQNYKYPGSKLLDVKRMINAHEYYFSCYYGKLSVVLNNKDRFSHDDLKNIQDIILVLDKEYMVFKDVVDLYNIDRGYLNEALHNHDVYQEEVHKNNQLARLYQEYLVNEGFFFEPHLSPMDSSNLAYLLCLPFNQGFSSDSSLVYNENLDLFKNLPLYSGGRAILYNYDYGLERDGNITITRNVIKSRYGRNTHYYDEVLHTHDTYKLFTQLPYHNTVNLDYEPIESESNLKGFSELPFSDFEDTDLDAEKNVTEFSELPFAHLDENGPLYTESEENMSGFSELPFHGLDYHDAEENMSGFSELPFANSDEHGNTITDTLISAAEVVLETAEEFLNNF